MRPSSPYEVLGVTPDATADEIRSAFRERVRASHPDTTTSPGDDADVIAVVEAYRQLMAPTGLTEVAGRSWGGSGRRVEVRRGTGDPQEPSARVRCDVCDGAGVIEVRSVCADCGGAGRITRLEAHQAGVERCRRCRGRGGELDRDVCQACRGSGRLTELGE